MTKVVRKTYCFRDKEVIEVEEYTDANYGAPGTSRVKRQKPTPEQMAKKNQLNKEKRCRHKLLQYFNVNDIFATWTYRPENRPADMKEASLHFQKAIRKVKKLYRKAGKEMYWIRNIERGTKGAWHIHLIVNALDGVIEELIKAWPYGGTYCERIYQNRDMASRDFSRLAAYMTKSQIMLEVKENGDEIKHRVKESSFSTSRNMPIKEPKKEKKVRWGKVKPKKGYQIIKEYEGVVEQLGFRYRRYTMLRI